MSPSRTGRLATTLTLAAVTLAAACGGDATSRPPDAATPIADAAATPDAAPAPPDAHATHDAAVGSTLTVTVPASYSGAPRQLAVVATKTVPIAGVPDAILLVDNAPAVSAGATLSL